MGQDRAVNGLKIFFGVLLLGMILLTAYVSAIKAGYRKDLGENEKSLDSLFRQNIAVKQTKIKRIGFLEKQFFMNHPRRFVFATVDLLESLDRTTPAQLELKELRITPRNRNLRFRLSGLVRVVDPSSARRFLNRFLERLRTLKEMVGISLTLPKTENMIGLPSPFRIEGELEIE
jgi:hypothetical protein